MPNALALFKSPRALWCAIGLWLMACLLPWPVQAAESLSSRIEATARAHAAGLPGEVVVTAGKPAAGLPACATPEVFMPPGSKPWGEVLVGVRCEAGAAWTRFVPVQIGVSVRHAVAQQALPAGHRLVPGDVQWISADLARLPRDVVLDEALLAGAMTVQPLAAGAPLRRELLKAPPVILQGQRVKVLLQGSGFQLSTEGKAQASAAAGQPVPIRMASGQVVSAVARPDGSADKAL